MAPSRHELLDALAAMTDKELKATLQEARQADNLARFSGEGQYSAETASAILGFPRNSED